MSLTGIEQIASDFDKSQAQFQKSDPQPKLSAHSQIMVSQAKETQIHIATRADSRMGSMQKVQIALGLQQDPEWD